jgi:hypothetical protein
MSDTDEKPDPFKPDQPNIPGVPYVKRGAKRSRGPAGLLGGKAMIWLGVAIVAVLVVGFGVVRWSHGKPAPESPPPDSSPSVAAPVEPTRPAAKPLPQGPGKVATTTELAKPWSSQAFNYHNPVTSVDSSAMLVHLPSGGFWAFSLREPYGTCTLDYITDLEKIKAQYNFTAEYPLVADPCNRSLFDLTKYGPGADGLVRGQIVEGEAVRPPIAIEVKVKGKDIIIGRSE